MTYQLIHGSAHNIPIPDKSVHAICTSPPYFSLRRYAGDQEIDWQEMSYSPMAGLPEITIPAQRAALGLEKDISSYIGHLILCLREWHRILRDDGTVWCNLGSAYAGETMESDLYCLREDLTPEEVSYVLSELASAQNDSANSHD